MFRRRFRDARRARNTVRTTITASVEVVAECSSSRMYTVCGKRAAVKMGLRCKGCLGRARKFRKAVARMREEKEGEERGWKGDGERSSTGGKVGVTGGLGTVDEPFVIDD